MKTGFYLALAAALATLFGPGCAPRYPNDTDHQGESEACVSCHFYGNASRPQVDHWDGAGNVTYDHEECGYCHVPK